MYSVYILYSKSSDRYYVGYTNDLKRLVAEHNRKKGKYTDAGIPWEIVHSEQDLSGKKCGRILLRRKCIKAGNPEIAEKL
ncbi:MAG TPA: GIY-YIG nuclease family protein [Bacteroidales bacterium]|jgi:putative endonuclease|nr:GIY-YIG nuclease family protein [Bacteroidales bacterium]HQJ81920.1 GIY-YIG nuclease family protein [Bacteroidales bacterium]